jgi:hypothetical protein
MSYIVRNQKLRSPAGPWAALLALAVLLIAGPAPAAADYDDYPEDGYGDTAGYEASYSYVRTLDGSATLVQGDTRDRDALQVNQPILVGDSLWVAPNGRAEVVLSDGNRLRIDGGTEIALEALAASPDRDDPSTILRLSEGNIQLVVDADFLGDDYPRIDTPNATVYANQTGTYRITASEGWSEVVARWGAAEVVTREGSVIVRQGEEAVVEGRDRPRTQVRRASREDSLEIWGERLDDEGRYASRYVDDSISYESAHLDRYGSWSRIDGRYAWRPRVADDWRPYWNGRWRHSPLGLTWVSYEPWGWVPYHYGTWDYVPGYGWTWFPGHRFSPAWVYWYWTDHYAGWVPLGYYSRHYWSSYGRYGLRAGVYGYTGGHWGHYGYWNFCDLRYFGQRYQYRHHHHGDRFGSAHRYAVPKRGVLTTDTRGITRTAVQRGEGIERLLIDRGTRGGRELADVTPFVERRKELPDDVRGRVVVDRGDGSRGSDARRPTRLVATDGVPGAGDGPSREATSGTRSPRRVVEREAPGTAGIERTAPVLRSRPDTVPARAGDAPRATPSTPRATPSKDWREREARPRREAPARVERGDTSPARSTERPSPNEVRRRPDVREPEPDRSSITRRVIEGVRSNDRRTAPSSTERSPSRTERAPSRTESPPPARSERSGSATRSSSPSRRESARPSRSESPPPRSSPSSRSASPSRSRASSPPPSRARTSRPSGSSRSSGARSAPSRPSRPPASTRSSSRPSRSSSARSARPSRPPSRASSSRSSRSGSKARSSRPSRSPSRASSSRPSRSSSKARSSRSSRSPSRSKARRGKPPTL